MEHADKTLELLYHLLIVRKSCNEPCDYSKLFTTTNNSIDPLKYES